MGSLISTFHLNVGLFVAQLVNFAIVFAILYWFAFKPLVKIMAERSKKIDQSLKDADEVKKRLLSTTQERETIIIAARKQANIIIEKADENGEKRRNEILAKTREEVGQVINKERAILLKEKAETLQEIKKNVAELVILTVEKLLDEKMDNEKDNKLIKKLVK